MTTKYRIVPYGVDQWAVEWRAGWFAPWLKLKRNMGYQYYETISFDSEAEAEAAIDGWIEREAERKEMAKVAAQRPKRIAPRNYPRATS